MSKKILHESCRMGRRIVGMKLICSLGHCECDGHTVHKLSQRLLPADLLAPRESDCTRMHSKVSSDWLQCYVTSKRPVLEIFKLDGYVPDRPRMHPLAHNFQVVPRDSFSVGGGGSGYFTIETGRWPLSFEGLTYALQVPVACGNISQLSTHLHCIELEHKLTWKRNTFQ
jgi:hypothetical protein